MSKYKLDLQLFAEGDGSGTGDGSGAGAEGTNGNNQGGEGSKETGKDTRIEIVLRTTRAAKGVKKPVALMIF